MVTGTTKRKIDGGNLSERGWNMSFPANDVHGIRIRLGLDYEGFACLIGVTSRSVRRWESDGTQGKIPGSPGGVLAALKYGLKKDPDKLIKLASDAVAMGGLAFLLVELLAHFLDGNPSSTLS